MYLTLAVLPLLCEGTEMRVKQYYEVTQTRLAVFSPCRPDGTATFYRN